MSKKIIEFNYIIALNYLIYYTAYNILITLYIILKFYNVLVSSFSYVFNA